ncbi:MAG: hypothetical protein H7101_05755 [Deinococcales bacterium]|nr:hypothetical protein [Chitinophagaceae bacterium]
MGFFYTATDKEIYAIRRKIFTKKGILLLYNNAFEKSLFSTPCFGKYSNQLHTYDLCKLTEDSMLQMITVHILGSDKWIQIKLNIFQLDNTIKCLQQLNNVDGIKFHLTALTISEMRLHSDDFKGIPLLNYDFMFRNHKLKSYCTKWGLERSIKKLEHRIVTDLTNFDKYVARWHKIFSPLQTTIEGEIIGHSNMSFDKRPEMTGLIKRFNDAKHKDKKHATSILK